MNTSSINQAISPVSQCQLQQMCSKLSQHQLQWMYSSIQLQWMYSSTSPSGCVPPTIPVSSSNIQWSRLYLQFLSVNSSKCVLRQMFQSPAPMSNEPGHFFSSPSINSSGCIPVSSSSGCIPVTSSSGCVPPPVSVSSAQWESARPNLDLPKIGTRKGWCQILKS